MAYIGIWDGLRIMREGTIREEKWRQMRRQYSLAIHVAKKKAGSRLLDLFWNIWDREATDPRDKVFAVLGVAESGSVGTDAPAIRHPELDEDEVGGMADYSKDMRRVFKEVASKMIKREKSLDILLAGCCLSRSDGQPSWVPDWRRAANGERPSLFGAWLDKL